MEYENEFKDVNESSIRSSINSFISSLNSVNYNSSGCFPMNTNANYDATFNNGIEKLNNDIKSMVELCEKCISEVINKISEYKRLYKKYQTEYEKYKTEYATWSQYRNACKEYKTDYERWSGSENIRRTFEEPTAPTEPTTPKPDPEPIKNMIDDLKALATQIKGVSF
mgnify:CR=1 FL=1